MMKLIKSIALAIAVALAINTTYAQGGDSQLLPASSLKPFTSLRVDGDIDLMLIEVADSELNKIEYDLADGSAEKFKFANRESGVLVISLSSSVRSVDRPKVYLYYNRIEQITASAAQITLTTPFDSSLADITLENRASLSGEIKSDDLYITLLSGSNLTLDGELKYLTLRAQANTKAELRGLDLRSATITASQSAVVAITAGERLDVGAATKSIVKYWGEPKILRIRKSLIGGELIKQQ